MCNRGGGWSLLAKELGIRVPKELCKPSASRIQGWYNYTDEFGTLLFQVGRKTPKGFIQRHPSENGDWIYNLKDTRRVLYRLSQITQSPDALVWIVEGEKDADRLASIGLVATTNPMGAKKWRDEYSEFLRDRDVVIIPDNDPVGEEHALTVARSLSGVTSRVRVLRLPGLPAKGDVSDWLDAGGQPQELRRFAEETPVWSADDESSRLVSSNRPDEVADDPHRLARSFVARRCTVNRGGLTLRFWRHLWWQWSGTHYDVLDKEELRASLSAFVKDELDLAARSSNGKKIARRVTHQLITNVMQALSGMTVVPFRSDQPVWLGPKPNPAMYLSMANGLVDVEDLLSGKGAHLHPHTPEWFSQHHLPYEFEPKAECPHWLSFINEILEGDSQRIRLLQEWFGYCLLPDTSLQKFIVYEGEGANGKSVVCAVQTELLGRQNVSHVPLERFGDRFQLTMTLGKLANIASEVGDLDRAAEGVLKAFTSGDRMGFDRKGIPGVEAFPTARLVLSINNRPRFSDRSSGLWRRMLMIPFRVSIPEDRQNPRLAKELTEELPGIFCWAIAGLCGLRGNGRFTRSEVGHEALEEYRAEVNPSRLFLTEVCVADLNCTIACAKLYEHYKSWCEVNGYRPLGERMFGKEVVRIYPTVRRTKKGTRERREYQYEGISVSYVS